LDIGKNTHFKWVWNLNAIGSIMVQCRNDPYLEHASVSYRRHTFETFLGGVTIVTPPKYFTFSFWFCNQHLRIFAQKVDIQVLKIRNDKFWPEIPAKIILKGKKFKIDKKFEKVLLTTLRLVVKFSFLSFWRAFSTKAFWPSHFRKIFFSVYAVTQLFTQFVRSVNAEWMLMCLFFT